MTRIFVALAMLGSLACGSSTAAKPESGTVKPVTKVDDKGTAKGDTEAPAPEDKKLTLEPAPIDIPNGHLYNGYIVGGLPTKAAIDKALELDIESALSVMGRDEPGISEIAPYAASKGFRYIRFSIVGKGELDESMAWQFASTLPLLDKPSIIHGSDGKRVAAIFALMAFFVEDVEAEEALKIGLAIGLGDLEDHVRELLELPAS